MTAPKITAVYPVTPTQQGFLFGTLASPDDALFTEQAVFPLTGCLDMKRLRHACARLVSAHEILRTAFAWDLGGAARQVVLSAADIDIELAEAAGLTPDGQEAQLQEILQQHQRTPFDLTKPPLMRLAAQRIDDTSHQLIWAHHHGILDGWSQLQLVQELLYFYNDAEHARPARACFGQYALWLARQDREPHQAFWSASLRGYVPPPQLPIRPVAAGQDRFGVRQAAVTPGELGKLDAFAQAHGLTMASLLVTCWAMVAVRHRSADRIAVGVTISGRHGSFPGMQTIAGPLATTVPVKVCLDGQRPFWELARDVQNAVAHAAEASDCSAGEIHAWAGLPADRSAYDSVVAIGNYPGFGNTSPARGAIRVPASGIRAYGGRTMQPLTLVTVPFGGLGIRLVNDRSRVSDTDADAASACLRNILTFLLDSTRPLVGDVFTLTEHLGALDADAAPSRQPRTASLGMGTIEQVVADAFGTLLNCGTVPIDADFIALGGHSLLAVKLLAQLRQAFAADLTLGDLLRTRTPHAVAARISELASNGSGSGASVRLPAITPDIEESDEPFPLTGIQQAYWAGRQTGFELGGVDSHLYGEIDIPCLDIGRLETAWRHLIRRHPMLRAVITTDGRQRVLPTVPGYRIAVADLRQAPDGGSHDLTEIRDRLSHVRRDITRWPLFTLEAALLPDGATRLFMSFDLLIGDAVSWKILYREICRLYDDPDATLPELQLRFRDYVAALPAIHDGDGYAQARQYWRDRLDILPSPPTFPTVTHPREIGKVRFSRRQLTFPADDVQALRQVARDHGVTLSTLLLAAFSETVGRYAGASEFLVNVTIYDRIPIHPQVDDVVGDFTSLLLTHVSLTGATFGDRLRRLQGQLWADLDHRLYSGLEVLRDLRERSEDRTSATAPVVFTSTLDLNTVPAAAESPLPGTVVYGIGQTPQVLFDYQTYQADGRLVINWDTVDGLFPAGFIAGMLDEHAAVLRALATDRHAARRPQLIPLPRDPELPAPLGGEQLLHEPFLAQVHRTPDAVAVISGSVHLTYSQLHTLASQVAARIAALSSQEDLVAVVMEKGWEQVAGVLGTLMAGYAFVPIEASWPSARIAALLAKTNASVVVTQSWLAGRLRLPGRVRTVLADQFTSTDPAPVHTSRVRAADDLAYVIFTSGSTGAPKGVMITHRGAANTVLDINARFSVGPQDRTLAISPFSFDLSIYDVFGTLAAGAAIVVPQEDERNDPRRWWQLADTERISVWNSVPVLMDLLADALPLADGHPLRHLRVCLLSGDWIPLQLPGRIRSHAPNAQVISLGGATEGSVWSVLFEIGHVDPQWASIPYGRPMTGQLVQVLGDRLTPCPPWTPGQIHIGGHGTALGYWDEPELTGDAFIRDARTGRRLYRTGDWGRLRPDGTIEFLGRRDEQVKVRGYRVEIREVEAALHAVSGVSRAAVVATGDRTDRRLAAFIVTSTDADTVRSQFAARMPSHMIPSTISTVDRLPVTPAGKIDRAQLRRTAEDLDASQPTAGSCAHQAGTVSAELAVMVTSLVPGVPQPETDLLDYGLTSVDVIRLCNAVEQRFGHRPDVRDFYRAPTLRALAHALTAQSPPGGDTPGQQPPSATEWAGWHVITDPDDQDAFKSERPVFPPAGTIRLLPVMPPQWLRRRASRRSPRAFSSAAVPLQQLGCMLDCLRRVPVGERRAFLYPSAGGLYSVAAYIHVRPGRVAGLVSGLYYYHPDAHDLLPLVGDLDLDTGIHLGPANRPAAQSAAFTIFLCTDPADSAPLYPHDAQPLGLLNAGYMGQLLCDSAAETGLGLCPVHGVNFDAIRWMFPHSDRLVLLHTLLGGVSAPPPADLVHGTAAEEART